MNFGFLLVGAKSIFFTTVLVYSAIGVVLTIWSVNVGVGDQDCGTAVFNHLTSFAIVGNLFNVLLFISFLIILKGVTFVKRESQKSV